MFRGAFTALITPFKNGALDEAALRSLVEWQITEGIHGLVPVGTTGESPTLSHAEHERAVGYEDPDAGQLVWFTLTKGPVHYVPDIDLYFKMFPVGDGSGGH